MSHDSSTTQSGVARTVLLVCLSLLILLVLVLTSGMLALCSFTVTSPGVYPGDISDRAATILGVLAVGACLLGWALAWLLVRSHLLARSSGTRIMNGSLAIAALNGVLLLIPLFAWKNALQSVQRG